MAVTSAGEEVLGSFLGSEEFPIEWEEGEQELFWIYDDLHCPNPVSPMFFDIGGWWLTCDHMFRRFGTPFACDWIAKEVNGYVYTAAVPADSRIHSEATEYQARYVPRVPRDPEHPAKIGAYLGWVLPHYAENFLDWWRDRLRPEIERNFEYLDDYDTDAAGFIELAVLLEDAIDIHDRHWKIHWMLNFAQFASTQALNGLLEEEKGEAAAALMGRLQSSVADRNWDSIEDLWKMKEEIKGDAELAARLRGRDRRARSCARWTGSERGQALRRGAHRRRTRRAFGYKAIWSHEFAFKTWREDPAPMIEAVRGYLATDYDYPSNIDAVREDLEAAKARGARGRARAASCRRRSSARCSMNPLTPDHHFYIDQGTNARLRLVLMAIGRKLVEAGTLDDPEDVMFLRYNELRLLMADQGALDARATGRRPPRRSRGGLREAPAVVGRHRHADRARLPLQRALGLPGEVPRGRARDDRRGQGAGRVAGRGRGPGALRDLARRVRPGPGRRDPRLPHDEPGLGRAVHEDHRARDRGGRRGLAPGRGGARVRHPGRGRHDERRRADRDGRPRARERHHRAWSRSSADVTADRTGSRRRRLEEALELRGEHGDDATVLAGGTFVGILMNQGFLEPQALLSLGRVRRLDGIEVVRRRAAARRDGDATGRSSARPPCARAGRCWRARSRSSPARGCATRRRSAACSPTPTTPRTRPRCWPRSARGWCCARRAASARSASTS